MKPASLLLPALAVLAAGACRRTRELPVRPEEIDVVEPVPLPPDRPGLELPGRTAERITLVTEDAVELAGWFFHGTGDGPRPVALLLHGEWGDRRDWNPLLRRLLPSPTARLDVLAIDLRGHGDSLSAGGRLIEARTLQHDAAALPDAWVGLERDAAAALAWLRDRHDAGTVVAFAIDLAVPAILRAAAAAPADGPATVRAVVALSPAERRGLAFDRDGLAALARRGVRVLALAAEGGDEGAPAGVRALEQALGLPLVDAEVLAAGGRGVALLASDLALEDRALAFVADAISTTRNVPFELPDGGPALRLRDGSIDPTGPVVLVVPDAGAGPDAGAALQALLAHRLPADVVVLDASTNDPAASPAAEAAVAADDAEGVPVGAAPTPTPEVAAGAEDGTNAEPTAPPGDPRAAAMRTFAGRIASLIEAEVRPAGRPERRGFALVCIGTAAPACAEALLIVGAAPEMPALRALALISPVANYHGLSIWPGVGEIVRPREIPVFAAAGRQTAMSRDDQTDGMGSQAKTVRQIQAVAGPERTVTRISASAAHGDALFRLHPEVGDALARFLGERLLDAAPAAYEPAAEDEP